MPAQPPQTGTSERPSMRVKQGGDGKWQIVGSGDGDVESPASGGAAGDAGASTGTPGTLGLMLRIPAATPGDRASSVGSAPSVGSRRRRAREPPSSSRSSRRRTFSPSETAERELEGEDELDLDADVTNEMDVDMELDASVPSGFTHSPAPSSIAERDASALAFAERDASALAFAEREASLTAPAAGTSHALSIFAADTEAALPAALEDVIGVNGVGSRLRRREPAGSKDGTPVGKRPTRGHEAEVRTGVSASGRGVKVGALKAAPGKKGKARVDVPNQDFCSACRGIGRFLCCDGCPRSFHFMCLEPPLRVDELPDEETWYCRKCRVEREDGGRRGRRRERDGDNPIGTVFGMLEERVETENPTQFKLPQEIRQFFTGVATGAKGEYVDAEEVRIKTDRKGFQEERDGTRLRDAKSHPVACYRCGGSSIPTRALATDPDAGAAWRPIVSCDYCQLHWHLDCLSPPLTIMPSSSRKWMCPNHAEAVMPRRRTVRNGLETVDIESPGARNNGNVVVVPAYEAGPEACDDRIINNRRYRVPERVIQLDFWNKLGLGKGRIDPPARPRRVAPDELITAQDAEAAHLVLSFFQAAAPSSSFAPAQLASPVSVQADAPSPYPEPTHDARAPPVNGDSAEIGDVDMDAPRPTDPTAHDGLARVSGLDAGGRSDLELINRQGGDARRVGDGHASGNGDGHGTVDVGDGDDTSQATGPKITLHLGQEADNA
ncbi:hypothetical protein Q5752_003060 [Cryptotrichosporon argae]